MSNEERWLLEEKYSGKETPEYFADIKRLKAGEPLGYLIGYVPFLNCKIYLSSDVESVPPIHSSTRHHEFLSGDRTGIKAKKFALIPRPETEFWVEKAIAEVRGAATQSPRVLDLCAGSGCIGVAVLKELPESHVTFAELESTHLPTIAKNLKENDIDCTRYQVFQSDLFTNLTGTFDYILTNPPYIDPALDRADASVKDHEPHVALYGGEAGMELITRIITDAPHYLTKRGVLYIEHEPEQSTAVQKLATEHGFRATTYADQYKTERYSRLERTDEQNMAK